MSGGEKTHKAPRLLSLEFHTRFFPALLRGRLRGQRKGSGFHSFIGLTFLLILCIFLIALGASMALRGTMIGWVVCGIGGAGVLVVFMNSVASRRGESPSFDGFLVGFFFFFTALGLSAGLFVGTLEFSLFSGLLMGAAGLVAGYALGILAGLGLQYLGWLAAVLDPLAGLAVLGMLVVDLVLVGGAVFG